MAEGGLVPARAGDGDRLPIGNREKAAKMLGISMATLYRELEVKAARVAKKS